MTEITKTINDKFQGLYDSVDEAGSRFAENHPDLASYAKRLNDRIDGHKEANRSTRLGEIARTGVGMIPGSVRDYVQGKLASSAPKDEVIELGDLQNQSKYVPTDTDKNPVELLTEEPGQYHLSINDEGKPERIHEVSGDVWMHPSLSGPVPKPGGGVYTEVDKPTDMVTEALGGGGRVHLALSGGLGGSKTPAPGITPTRPVERKLTPEEMMKMATDLENQYKQRTAELDYMPSSVEPTLARSETYRDAGTPPDWLTKYMESQPTTGTIAFDNNGHQKYLAHRERLRKLKEAKDR